MKRKISLLLAIIIAICSCIALSSCGETTVEEEDNTTYLFDYRISEDGTYYIVTGYGVSTETVSTIPSEYDGKPVKEIKEEAFDRDTNKLYIEQMTLPATIEKIGASAYYGCSNLKTLNFGSGLKFIGHGAFAKCSSLTELVLPEGFETISELAFRECSALKSITLPTTLKFIGANAFAGTKYLNETAVKHNGNVTYVSTTDIKAWVIYANFDIVDANLPDNAVGIASEAFAYCDALTTVEIPAGVKYINADAFKGCTSLTTINYCGTPTEFGKIIIESGNEAFVNATVNYVN